MKQVEKELGLRLIPTVTSYLDQEPLWPWVSWISNSINDFNAAKLNMAGIY
jgi:hypothetical protein